MAISFVVGNVYADELEALASEAMALSGTQAVLEGMVKMLDSQTSSDPRLAKLTPPERTQLLATLKNAFDGQRMANDLKSALAGTHDRERLAAAVKTMRQPQYQALTQAFAEESLRTTDQEVLAYAKQFEQTPPDPARVQLILRLDAATDGSRILADIHYDSLEAMIGDKASAEDRAQLLAMREQIETNAKNEFILRSLHMTRKLDIPALETYVNAHENEPMGWLSRQLGYGLQRAIAKAAGEAARSMAALGSPKSPQ